MRIFEVLNFRSNAALNDCVLERINLHDPLLDLGHEVVLYNLTDYFALRRSRAWFYRNRDRFSEQLLELIRREHAKRPFTLFFSVLYSYHLAPAMLDELRRMGIVTANFSCNNVHQFDLVEELAPYFDYCLVSEAAALDSFRRVGANAVYWQLARNPKFFAPVPVARDYAVTFAGARYADRPDYVHYLLERGVRLDVFGVGWPLDPGHRVSRRLYRLAREFYHGGRWLIGRSPKERYLAARKLAYVTFQDYLDEVHRDAFHGPVSDADLVTLYSRSEINLNFSNVYMRHTPGEREESHLRGRDFEVPLARGLYFTAYSEELTHFYEPEREVITYRGREELLDKVWFYLAHPVEADRVREAGYRRALACHTSQRRFQEFFDRLAADGKC